MAETNHQTVYIHRVNSSKWRLVINFGSSRYCQNYNPRRLTVRHARDLWERASRYYHGLTIFHDDFPDTSEPRPFAEDPVGVVAEILSEEGSLESVWSVQRGRPQSWWGRASLPPPHWPESSLRIINPAKEG
jgi:hypothetical protein